MSHTGLGLKDLPKVTEKLKELEKRFRDLWGIAFDDFMQKIHDKGYLSSSKDEETQTKEWDAMSRDASRIDLGRTIKKALEDNDYLEVSYEE